MKKIFYFYVLFYGIIIYGQDTTIKNNFPNIIPPSISVESLMKYQEIPVNNYTGVPDISIPLLNVSTLAKDINIDISLKYHQANVKADNIAGDVGLGWSLLAGGTISRTVRGLPDEELKLADGMGFTGRVGIYQTDIPNHSNVYYLWCQDPVNYEQTHTQITDEYYWETIENGKYDTEHDIWHFNFMGNTGSFYMKKVGNEFIIEPLSDYRLKIINYYETSYNQQYTPKAFTIFDEKGYKYIFDIYETTTRFADTENITMIQKQYVTYNGHSNEKPFRSSFQLTKVIDPNGKTIFEISYNTNNYIEASNQYNRINNEYGNDGDALFMVMNYHNCWSEVPPMKSTVINSQSVSVKKIKLITIPGKAIIDFTYNTGRNDYLASTSTPFLKEIKLKSINNNTISTHTLDYDYNQIIYKRLFLKSVTKNNPISNAEKYDFFYKRNSPMGVPSVFGRDYWGYYNTFNGDICGAQDITFMRDASPLASTFDLLQKIKYPTKGSVIFNFELNQYSFIGDQAIDDFSENPLNTSYIDTASYYFNNANLQFIPVSHEKRKITVYPSIILDSDPNTWTRTFSFFKIVNGQNISIGSIHCISPNNNCCREFILEPNVQYAFRRNNLDINYTGTDNLTVKYYSFNQSHKYLLGGGNRINRIGYFDTDVPQDYYEVTNQNYLPSKEKIFTYNLPTDNSKSSGSLVFGKPKFEEYKFLKIKGTRCVLQPYSDIHIVNDNLNYLSRFIISNQETVFTQGVNVGYKNINVKESGNGTVGLCCDPIFNNYS
jgi:hypothetical protein